MWWCVHSVVIVCSTMECILFYVSLSVCCATISFQVRSGWCAHTSPRLLPSHPSCFALPRLNSFTHITRMLPSSLATIITTTIRHSPARIATGRRSRPVRRHARHSRRRGVDGRVYGRDAAAVGTAGAEDISALFVRRKEVDHTSVRHPPLPFLSVMYVYSCCTPY